MMDPNNPFGDMSEKQIDELYSALKDNIPEAITKQREVIDAAVVDPNAPLESEELLTNVDSAVTLNEQGLLETDMSIFDVAEGELDVSNTESFKANAKVQASTMFDLDDDDSMKFLEVMLAYRENKDYPVYRNMPEKMRTMIKQMMVKDGIPMTHANMMACLVVDELIAETSMDEAFVDFQKSMDEALAMPSVTDMYSEHMDTVMNEKIPEAAQNLINEGHVERAKLLISIKDVYTSVYSMQALRDYYMSSARARKSVRKKFDKYQDFCDDLNFRNEQSRFKIDDAQNMYSALEKVFIVEAEEGNPICSQVDLMKVIVLFCESCMDKNPEDIVDASYMYYGMKNLIYLGYTKEGKTDFTVQLINNLKDLIEFINIEEEKRNVSDDSGSNRKAKRSVKSRGRCN